MKKMKKTEASKFTSIKKKTISNRMIFTTQTPLKYVLSTLTKSQTWKKWFSDYVWQVVGREKIYVAFTETQS